MKAARLGALCVSWLLLCTEVCVAAGAPDLVRLKGGALFRGTISEYIPDDHVLITLPNGEERRIPAPDILYAGPAPQEDAHSDAPVDKVVLLEEVPPPAAPVPQPPPPAPGASADVARVPGQMIPVRLENEGDERLAFYVRGSTSLHQQLCIAPCTAEVKRGTHKFALSTPDGKPVYQQGLITLRDPSTLRGHLESNSSTRGIGWALLGVGALGVTVSPLVARENGEYDESLLGGLFVAGAILVGMGLALGLTRDEAQVTVQHGIRPAGNSGSGSGARDARRSSAPAAPWRFAF